MHKNMRRSLIMQMKPALLVMLLEHRGRDPFLRRGAFIYFFALERCISFAYINTHPGKDYKEQIESKQRIYDEKVRHGALDKNCPSGIMD